MARSCAFRIGPRRFELVTLDGSPKKHKISAYYAGEFERDEDGDSIPAKAAALKDVARAHRIPKENVSIVMDSGRAAFRRVIVPFTDRAKIDQVLKYEIESDLPQFNIDDVVVDYHVLEEREDGAELLVTAVPKDDVAHVVAVCEKAGIEPLEIELETTALVNAAVSADLCHLDDAQLLVQVGEYSTSVVVMDAGTVREMRVIHIGALSHELAQEPVVDGAGDTEGEEEESESAGADPIESARRLDQSIKRIRRELGRSVSGARTINAIEAIHVGGMELPGLIGSTVLDVPVYILDCFEQDSGQPADGYGQLVAAYGGAYRQLGGGAIKPSLRREELRFTGTWERLEFPVAIAALLLATFLGMINILQKQDIDNAEVNGALVWLQSSNNFAIGNPRKGGNPRINPPIQELTELARLYDPDSLDENGLPAADAPDPLDALETVHSTLRKKRLEASTQAGVTQEIKPPQSAFVAMVLVLDVLREHDEEWRVSVRSVDAQTQFAKGAQTEEQVTVSLDLSFFGATSVEGSEHFTAFKTILRTKDWCLSVEDPPTEGLEASPEDEVEGGLSVEGLDVTVDVDRYFAAVARSSRG